MSRLPSRPTVIAVAVGVVLIVVAVVLVTRNHRPDFRVGDESSSSQDGERLMAGRRTTRKRVFDPDNTRVPALVEQVGPGSAVLAFRTLVLDGDAQPVRIRQRTLVDLGVTPAASRETAVRWRGYVAVQGPLSGGRSLRDSIGPWRAAGRDGVLVQPGQQVRLRTRYDLQRRNGKACRSTVLEDGPRWEVQEEGGSWGILRARDDSGSGDDAEQRDVEVRTGQVGPLAFTSTRPCGINDSSTYTLDDGGVRDAEDLDYGGI